MNETEIIFYEKYLEKYAILDFKDRLEILLNLFEKNSINSIDSIKISKPTPISLEDTLKIHHKNLVDEIFKTKWLDIARLSAGGALFATKNILEKESKNAYVLVPIGGHHAGPYSHWGFCYLNETAFVVDYLRKEGIKKILYIDQDYHHADGSEKFFKYDKDLFFICLHGSRELGSFVKFKHAWNHLDVSLPKGIGGLDYLDIMKKSISIAIERFKPEFIIAYMGYDGHYLDSFSRGKMKLDQYTYYKLILEYKNLAARLTHDKLLCILGGGYNAKENAIAIYNAIMVLSENWDLIIENDSGGIQPSSDESKWKISEILRDLEKIDISTAKLSF
jgi:acetoin utilization deacetylase AcuC-like enzyme